MIEAKSVKELNENYQEIINETKIADKVKESLLSAASDWSVYYKKTCFFSFLLRILFLKRQKKAGN
jgi:hypothetical protein